MQPQIQDIKKSILEKGKEFCYIFYMLLDQLEKTAGGVAATSIKNSAQHIAAPVPQRPSPPIQANKSAPVHPSFRTKAYIKFFQEKSMELSAADRTIPPSVLSKTVAQKWKDMLQVDREAYNTPIKRPLHKGQQPSKNPSGAPHRRRKKNVLSLKKRRNSSTHIARNRKIALSPVRSKFAKENGENTSTRVEQMQSVLAQKVEMNRRLALKSKEPEMMIEAVES